MWIFGVRKLGPSPVRPLVCEPDEGLVSGRLGPMSFLPVGPATGGRSVGWPWALWVAELVAASEQRDRCSGPEIGCVEGDARHRRSRPRGLSRLSRSSSPSPYWIGSRGLGG